MVVYAFNAQGRLSFAPVWGYDFLRRNLTRMAVLYFYGRGARLE
ncbi:MAG TPA: hypothetical protein VKB12_06975 [Pyrinomonadaceae bacterium]|nr:hypothetical protein [Pyrinomonadaceae bacterium]